MSTDDFIEARLEGRPFSNLSANFQNYVIDNPEFLFFADLQAIYPMVTMRQMEFVRTEG